MLMNHSDFFIKITHNIFYLMFIPLPKKFNVYVKFFIRNVNVIYKEILV